MEIKVNNIHYCVNMHLKRMTIHELRTFPSAKTLLNNKKIYTLTSNVDFGGGATGGLKIVMNCRGIKSKLYL